MSNDLGKLVRQAREAKGWSQERLADEAKTSQTTIDKIERGETKRSKFLMNIFNKLDLKIEDIDPNYISVGGRHTYIHEQVARIYNDDRDRLPLYATFLRRDGTFEMVSTPAGYIEKPGSLKYPGTAYAIYISNFDLSPEFEPGDIAVLNPDAEPYAGSTCVFFNASEASIIIRRIIKLDDENWYLARWHPSTQEEVRSREEWPGCHRVVTRHLTK